MYMYMLFDQFAEGVIFLRGGEGSELPSDETMVQRFRDPNKEIASVNT